MRDYFVISIEFFANLLSRIPNLKKLFLYDCFKKNVPAEVWKLENLEILCLMNVGLTTLPKEIGNLKRLTKLFLNQNPIKSAVCPAPI